MLVTREKGLCYSPHPHFIVKGIKYSLKHVYFPKGEAEQRIEFDKLGTLEGFGKRLGECSTKHEGCHCLLLSTRNSFPGELYG